MAEVTDSRFQPGQLMDGRYELLRLLGRGGFAEVYAAHQLHIDREVALKILHSPFEPTRGGLERRERFVRDARLAARIQHPNVVTIHDFGVDPHSGQPYIAMELLQGHDLAEELLLRGPMAPPRALHLLAGALDALAVGHQQGIVHKDLKPSNLFLVHPGTPQEQLKIIDFGIALLGQEPRITEEQRPLGTAAYMAPEYIQDQLATPSLDVYQMGLILAEMLTGQPLVQGQTYMQCIFQHLSGRLELPPELAHSPLGHVLARATAHDHQDRYRDAGQFAQALRLLMEKTAPLSLADLAGGPTRALRSPVIPASKPPRARPWALVALLGALLLGAGLLLQALGSEPAPPPQEPSPLLARIRLPASLLAGARDHAELRQRLEGQRRASWAEAARREALAHAGQLLRRAPERAEATAALQRRGAARVATAGRRRADVPPVQSHADGVEPRVEDKKPPVEAAPEPRPGAINVGEKL